MAKIRAEIEIEVPNGAYCRGCDYCGIGVSSYCYLFNKDMDTKPFFKNEIYNENGALKVPFLNAASSRPFREKTDNRVRQR